MSKHVRRLPPPRLVEIAAICAASASLAVLFGTGALWLLRPDPPGWVPAVVKTIPVTTVTVPAPLTPPWHPVTVGQHR